EPWDISDRTPGEAWLPMPVTTRVVDPCARVCRKDTEAQQRLLGGLHRRLLSGIPGLTEHPAGSIDDADNTISRLPEYLSRAHLVKMAIIHPIAPHCRNHAATPFPLRSRPSPR